MYTYMCLHKYIKNIDIQKNKPREKTPVASGG